MPGQPTAKRKPRSTSRQLSEILQFRVSTEQRAEIEALALHSGRDSVSAMLRTWVLERLRATSDNSPSVAFFTAHPTEAGSINEWPSGFSCLLGREPTGYVVNCCEFGKGHATPEDAKRHGLEKMIAAMTANSERDVIAWAGRLQKDSGTEVH